MNEKLLILYLERLLDRLYLEIDEADTSLGPDAKREVIEPRKMSDIESAMIDAFNARQATKDLDEPETVVGGAIALDGLRIFAKSIGRDIGILSGSGGLSVDPSVYLKTR